MKCLNCGAETRVYETRKKGYFKVLRKRKCPVCNFRFKTIEKIAPLKILVKKKDGRVELFSEQKLKKGLSKAFTKRPIKKDEFEDLIEKIKNRVKHKKTKRISTKELGKIVMDILKEEDLVAYLRFASVYKNFGSLNSFEKEIKKLKKQYGKK